MDILLTCALLVAIIFFPKVTFLACVELINFSILGMNIFSLFLGMIWFLIWFQLTNKKILPTNDLLDQR